MKTNDKDIMRELFASTTDEPLPFDFNEKIMEKVRHKALLQERRDRWLAIFGYASGIAAMIAVCVFILYRMDISFSIPEVEWPALAFKSSVYSIFTSPSFKFCAYIGVLALFLIIVDSVIRRHIEKIGHK